MNRSNDYFRMSVVISETFVVPDTLLTLKLPLPPLFLQFTPDLMTVTLYFSTYLEIRSLVSIYCKTHSDMELLKLDTTPTLKSLHWLKIAERIIYNITTHIYDILHTSKPYYLRNLINIKPHDSTCSSDFHYNVHS